jgi:hypothetical protein
MSAQHPMNHPGIRRATAVECPSDIPSGGLRKISE